MKYRNRKERVAVFILRMQRSGTECRRVGFYFVNSKTRKPGKPADAKRFGFFIEPQDALDVLIGSQVEADNAKLANEDAVPASGLI